MEYFTVKIYGAISYRSTSRGRYLVTRGQVERPIEIKNEEGKSYIFSNVGVIFNLKEDASSEILIGVERDYVSFENSAILDINVGHDKFEELKNTKSQEITVYFHIYKSFIIQEKSFNSVLESLDVSICESREIMREPLHWYKNCSRYVAGQRQSQAFSLAEELLESFESLAAKDSEIEKNREEHLKKLDDLFNNFRLSVPRSLENYELLRSYSLDTFMEKLDKADESLSPDLCKAFNTFWESKYSLKCIEFGKLYSDATGELVVELVEETAAIYLQSNLDSPFLEWLLIDALLFSETMATYREFHNAFLKRHKNSLLAQVEVVSGSLGNEALSLFITLLLSLVAGNQWWLLFSIVTAVRWLRPSEANLNRKVASQLIESMAQVQLRTTDKFFNSLMVRERLYALEQRGAVFSHFAYNLLDKRIARENLNSARF